MILQLQEIVFRYRPSSPAVLSGLSMEIESGSVAAVLGPNGAGKSTLLDICLGWKQPSGGRVLLHGRPIGAYSRREAGSLMSLVPQDEQIKFDYTVLEYALLGRAPYLGQLEVPGKQDTAIALDALEHVGIGDLRGRPVTRLSGGEHQLLMIARALAQEPSIMLLDEPTSRLDPANRSRVLSILSSLSSSGVTVLFTSHDPSLAAGIADRLMLVRDGRLLRSGSTEEVLTGENLSLLYGTPMKVHTLDGKKIVVQC